MKLTKKEYFNYDHVVKPNPKRLQQQMIDYIIYYFCCHGRENLYSMKQGTFQIFIEPDGAEYLYQAIDEMDKNHGPRDSKKSNDGHVYSNKGK